MNHMRQLNEQPVFDRNFGMSMAAGRTDIYERMLHKALGYWDQQGEFKPLLELDAYHCDIGRMGELAHRAAGACRVCGMRRLADHLSAIFRVCDAGDLPAAEVLGAELPNLLNTTREQVLGH